MMACMTTAEFIPNHMKTAGLGKIQVIFGPMFSGKTTELIRRMKRYQIANYHCLIVKYANDNRYDVNDIATHDSQKLEASVSTNQLLPLLDRAADYDVVGVDEGQFFPDVVEFCEKLADCGKIVIVAALDGTFLRQVEVILGKEIKHTMLRDGFGNILNLVPLAESVIKLTAVCVTCYGEASFTKRKGQEKEVEVIGGADKYLAVCRACYHSPVKASPRKPTLPDQENKPVGKRLFGNDITSNNKMEC